MKLIEIILRAKPYIYSSSVINALWIEGSYATGKFTDGSDIDVWLDIVPSTQERAANDFTEAISKVVTLSRIGETDFYSADPKLAKVKFYIADMSDDNRIELDMQESTRNFIFDRQAHDIIVLFDKTGAIKYVNQETLF